MEVTVTPLQLLRHTFPVQAVAVILRIQKVLDVMALVIARDVEAVARYMTMVLQVYPPSQNTLINVVSAMGGGVVVYVMAKDTIDSGFDSALSIIFSLEICIRHLILFIESADVCMTKCGLCDANIWERRLQTFAVCGVISK